MQKQKFIQDCNIIHNKKYDYSKIPDEFSVRDKLCIICPKHGEFYQRVDIHRSGRGCPKCGHERTGIACRKVDLNSNISNILDIDFPIVKNPLIPEKQYIIGTIYLFINKINNKVYVGQTYNKYTERWTAHRISTDTYYFHRAIRKYGWDNFNKYVVEQSESYIINEDNINIVNKWLDEREQYYIKLFDSNNRDKGYNSTSGGKTNYPEFTQIINKTKEKKSNSKKVEQYDLNGNLIKVWNSVKEIYTTTQFKNDGISDCSKGLREFYKGYKWKIIDHEKQELNYKPITAPKPILQYDLNGNFMQEFESGTSVKRLLGIDDHLVRGCCNKVYNTSKGFVWIFKNENSILPKLPLEELESRNLDKRVIQKSLDGNIIKIWNTSTEASKALNLNSNGISKCARGKSKSSQGFIWENTTMRELIEKNIIKY